MSRWLVAMPCMAIVLAGCGGEGVPPPKGQVLAVVNGEEITMAELRAEAAARSTLDGDDPAVQRRLLQDMVGRKLLVQAARRDRLDQQIEYIVNQRRAEEVLLADLFIRSLGQAAAAAPETGVDRYLQANPKVFASHTIFQIDQIDARIGDTAGLKQELARARTLDAAAALLTAQGIVSQRSRTEWDSLFMPDELLTKVRRSPPDTPFVHSYGDKIVVGVVTAQAEVPIDPARRQVLVRQSMNTANRTAHVEEQVARLRSDADIRYQTGYGPERRDR